MNQIWLLLGLKPEGFRAGLKRARDDTKGFEADWKSLKKIFAAGGIATLALGFLKSFASDAQAARDELVRMGEPIPRTTRALAELGDAMERFKALASISVGYVAAGWQDLFNLIASGINRVRGISESQENERMAGFAAAEAGEKRLQKAREDNSPEKIAAAEKRLADTRRDGAFQAADNEGKMNILLEENIRLRELVNTTGEHSIKGAEARIALEKNLVEIRKVNADITKDEATDQKKIDDEVRKRWDEMIRHEKDRESMRDRLKKAQFERLDLEKQIEVLSQNQSALEKNIADAKLQHVDTLALEVQQAENLVTLDAKRAEYATFIADEAARAAAKKAKEVEVARTLKELNDKSYADTIAAMTQSGLDREQLRTANDKTLQEILRRKQGNLTSLGAAGGSLSFDDNYFGRIKLQNEINELKAQLDYNAGLRRDFSTGGEFRARRNFKGDPFQFEEALQRVTGQWQKQDEANDLLRSIKTSLSGRDGNLSELPSHVRDLTSATKAVATQLAQRGLRS